MTAQQTRLLIGLAVVGAICLVIITAVLLRPTLMPAPTPAQQTATVRAVFATIESGLNK
jgi:hypothetical protein